MGTLTVIEGLGMSPPCAQAGRASRGITAHDIGQAIADQHLVGPAKQLSVAATFVPSTEQES
jgi:hypothetical protein